ncbi:MAG: 4'-phosphopantetheinyl transferase superfamily protein [Desulfobacter sp.]|nr:MAG: 4'-phosphopantetheinyl transferase superfamily protein [Desulfobacter sp.]
MPEGAPFFKAFPDICVSLSHSGIYTGAALAKRSNTRMGIDIEALGPRPDKFFLNTAFTSREIQDMGKSPLDIFCRWTLKEAYLKYIRKGFNKSLLEVEVLQNKIFDQGRDQNLDCRSWELAHDFILSMVSGKNHL